jgi:hypothetical protein
LHWLFCVRSFDPGNTGKIGEVQFRKIMKSKEAIPDEDVEEMLSGKSAVSEPEPFLMRMWRKCCQVRVLFRSRSHS